MKTPEEKKAAKSAYNKMYRQRKMTEEQRKQRADYQRTWYQNNRKVGTRGRPVGLQITQDDFLDVVKEVLQELEQHESTTEKRRYTYWSENFINIVNHILKSIEDEDVNKRNLLRKMGIILTQEDHEPNHTNRESTNKNKKNTR